MSIPALVALLINSIGETSGATHIKAAAAAYAAGRNELKDKHVAEAIRDFQQAIDIEPTFSDAYHQLALAYIAAGKKLETGETLTRLLEIEPERNPDRILLGQLLIDGKQYERALAQFSLVLRQDPLNADALFGFAAAAGALGMQDRAAAALEKGRSKYPKDDRFRRDNTMPK